MAQQTNEQLSVQDFAEIRPWTVLPAERQNQPDAYRQPRYRLDRDHHPEWFDMFERAIYRVTQTGARAVAHPITRLVSEGFGHVEYLKRMADNRNQLVTTFFSVDVDIPDKTGTNLQSESQLQMMWHVQTVLNYVFAPYLYHLNSPFGQLSMSNWWTYLNDGVFRGLTSNFSKIGRLELEQNLRLRQGLGTLRDEFKWIMPFQRSLEDAYDAMSAAWNWAQTDGRDLDGAIESALQDIPEMTRLLIILLEREKSFDDVVVQEHIFGALYDKRIRLLSTSDLTLLWNHLHTFRRGAMADHWVIYQHLNGLYRQLTEWQKRLKELFDYKYLMDWHWNKMWDRVYVIIHPSMHISDRTIQKFVNWSDRNGVVAQNVFGVHPITSREMEHERCTVCLEDYDHDQHPIGVVLIKTKCGHYFHAKCLFSSWDVPSFWQNRCPLCRHSAGRLRDAVQFQPLMNDVEFEEGDNLQMDNTYYGVVEEVVEAGNLIRGMGSVVQDAFWRRVVEEDVLHPLREERLASKPTWESVLGG